MSEPEEPTWAENSWPTPEQWRDMFLSRSPERQLEMCKIILENAFLAACCTLADHDGRLRHLEASLRDAAARLSDDAGDDVPASQSDPEALPSSDENAIIERTRNHMPEEEVKRF